MTVVGVNSSPHIGDACNETKKMLFYNNKRCLYRTLEMTLLQWVFIDVVAPNVVGRLGSSIISISRVLSTCGCAGK